MPQKERAKSINWELLSLLVVLSLVILENRDMPVNFIPQEAWFWINEIIGIGGIILVIVIISRRIIKDRKEKQSIRENKAMPINNESDDITNMFLGLALIVKSIINISKGENKTEK